MDFIGFISNFSYEVVNEIKKSIQQYGFDFQEGNEVHDPELMEGLGLFLEKIEYNFLIQILKDKNDGSSAKVTEEIQLFSLYQMDSAFLNLLKHMDSLPILNGKVMYLLFASEWRIEDIELRYYKSASVSTIIEYFKINNGWVALHFNVILGRESIEENYPLLFRIQFGKSTLL